MTRPFIIYALPRSRTFWLSRFLSYRDWTCHHQAAIGLRDIGDIAEFFALPNMGTAETAVSLGWRILAHHVPNLRRVVIRRPVDDCVASMLDVDLCGAAEYDEALMRRVMVREARALDEIGTQRGVLTVDFADLDRSDACAAVFEHCLPHRFDPQWWRNLKDRNLQSDVPGLLRYFHAHRNAIENFKRNCKSELRRMAYAGAV